MSDRATAVFHWLGEIEYSAAWALQKSLVAERQKGRIEDTVLLLEHPHVYTLGRRGRREDVLLDDETLAREGIAVHAVDRGGEVTYHGPGQIVGYPIVDVRRIGGPVRYVRALEAALAEAMAVFGLDAHHSEVMPGIWMGEPPNERKLAAIGLRVSRGTSSHGFALNVSTDTGYFRHIVPCGVPGLPVTSMERELGRQVDGSQVRATVADALARQLGLRAGWAEAGETRAMLSSPALQR